MPWGRSDEDMIIVHIKIEKRVVDSIQGRGNGVLIV